MLLKASFLRNEARMIPFKTSTLILMSWLLLAANASMAYELNGTITDTGSENTYAVSVENEFGHVYLGKGVLQKNGQINMSVSDGQGEVFNGYAVENGYGDYELHLRNPYSGSTATGTVEDYEYQDNFPTN